MKAFIDFDDVLFNTKEFKKDLMAIFYSQGISRQLVYDTMYWDEKYNLNKQLKFLEKEYKIDRQKLKTKLDIFLQDLSKYVFPDVHDFLKTVGRENLFIISYGHSDWQRLKISRAGLNNFFQDIFIGKDKARGILQFLNLDDKNKISEKTYFIDDRVEYIEKVKKQIPTITTILLKRKEGRYNDQKNKWCDQEWENLKNKL